MDPVHLHLMLNHIPVIGMAFASVLLAYGLIRGQNDVTRVALLAIVVLAVMTFVVVRTGEGAEDPVERLADVVEPAIHPHEEAGEAALIAAIVAGVLALGVLFLSRSKERVLRLGAVIVFLATVVTFGLAGYAANLGGKIRHTEIGGAPAMTAEEEEHGRRGRDQ